MSQNQKPLIYTFVARGNVLLAEYTEFSGNFNSIAFQCLQKLPASNNKFTYNCDAHTFNYLVDDGYSYLQLLMVWLTFGLDVAAYCVVADESVGRQIPMAFLERIKDDFVSKYGGGKAATALANSLNKEFGPKLKEHMQYCVDHPEEISKLAKVKAQVSEVKGVMMENIEKVLDRGEKIELLVDKTENLHHQCKCEVEFKFLLKGILISLPDFEGKIDLLAGSRLPEYGDKNPEENVAAKHEDQADCVGNTDSLDPHHSSIGLPWLQLRRRKMSGLPQEFKLRMLVHTA
ncbi:hypothetical protein EZV62_027562 [Acer yangbiense]|uniref:Longin domain-containing protein n=1 Tax=Acer yangbiense TaxID=1000413 RepID=A0A5C7GU91_9ROSI|nr:hypothetical protein EZV62_027562 [Acer yangbiense]